MCGIFHIRYVCVGLDSQIWYLFIYITRCLNVRKISETNDFQTFVGPLSILHSKVHQSLWRVVTHGRGTWGTPFPCFRHGFRLFCGIFVIFLQCEGVFKGLFATLPAFSIRQNTFPLQKSGKFNGKVFWQIVVKPKSMERWFQQKLLLHHIKSNLSVNFSSFW